MECEIIIINSKDQDIRNSEVGTVLYFIDCMATLLRVGVATRMFIFNTTLQFTILCQHTIMCHI